MKRFILIFLLFLYGGLLSAQQPAPNIRLPRAVPATPEATALAKYINYPVDYSNGLVKIEIPIYEINEGDIKLPISLSYHASGFRVNEADGWLPRGWTLNAEPAISRSIQGLPDEDSYLSNNQSPNSLEYLKYLAEGIHDENPDEFYFRLSNLSGKFYLKKGSEEPVTVPFVPVKINYASSLSTFSITDTKGLNYSFGGPQFANVEATGMMKYTCWKATAINSSLTGRSVSFSYHPEESRLLGMTQTDRVTILDSLPRGYVPTYDYNPLSQDPVPDFQLSLPAVKVQKNGIIEYFKVSNDSPTPGQLVQLPMTRSGYDVTEGSIENLNIHEIVFTGGKLVFEKLGTSLSLLKSIKLLDHNNSLLRSFVFYYSNPPGTSKRLDSVVLCGSDSNPVERYRFLYDSYVPANASPRSIDHWGYYNAANNNNVSLIPPTAVSAPDWPYSAKVNFTIGGGDRSPNETAMQIGILKSVVYPSGGKTSFEYEAHRYKDPQGLLQLAGGLRISAVTNIDEKGQTIRKIFRYGANEDGAGFLPYPKSTEDYYLESTDLYCQQDYIGDDPFNPANLTGHKWYSYNGVVQLRRRTFACDPYVNIFHEGGSPVRYKEVTEYTVNDYETLGKKTYAYSILSLSRSGKVAGQSIVIDYKTDYYHGHDTLSRDYSGSYGNYSLVREQEKKYTVGHTPDKSFVVGKAYKKNNVISNGNPSWLSYENIAYVTYNVQSGFKHVAQTTDRSYDGLSPVVEEHNYKYDHFLNLTEDSTNTSDNRPLEHRYTYPYSFVGGGNMYFLNNNISPIITKETYIGNTLTEQTKYDYHYNTPSGTTESPFVKSLKYGTGSNPMETRVLYHDYDSKGNLLSVSLNRGVKKNYIWAYNGQYPVAEISNAEYSAIQSILGSSNINTFASSYPDKIAVDNFIAPLKAALPEAQITTYTYKPLVGMISQTDAKGMTTYYEYDNFQRLLNIKDDQGDIVKNYKYNYAQPAVTGVYYNTAVNSDFQKNDCPVGQAGSVVNYSVAANTYSAASPEEAQALATADLSANGQAYANTHGTCSGGSMVYYNTVVSQSFQKNNCPLGQTGSMVTYTVAAGAHSASSQAAADAYAAADLAASGQTYANNNGTCSTAFYNTVVSQSFQKNNCPSGQTGSTVTYTVAAGTHSASSQAAADALATADITANGQTYANANGTCSGGTIYYNTVASQSFQKNNCPSGQTGSSVTYTIATGTHSASSQSAADALATADLTANGQAYANANGSCGTTYYNPTLSRGFQKNNCPPGQSGSVVVYTVPAGTYSANNEGDAYNLAHNDISANGQAYANANGTCSPGTFYYNIHLSLPYQKSDCPAGYVGSTVMFTVPAGTYQASTQSAANNLATSYIYANGPSNANSNGTCTFMGIYYNTVQSQSFQKNNCPSGQTGSTVTYTVAANIYSASSQAAADSIALANIAAYGQNYANSNGTCSGSIIYHNTQTSQSFQKNNCPSGQTGSSVTYTVAANTYSASSQSAADALATADVTANGQNYANANGSCSTIYYNVQASQNFQKNNCPSGQTGSLITYTVAANTYSASSQSAADALATSDITANGQNYANSNGTCTGSLYYNTELSQNFQKNDCLSGQVGSIVTYTVLAGTYSATTQAAANALAAAEISSNGQDNANINGYCVSAIYVRFEIGNQTVTQNNATTPSTTETYADLYLRFYSDQACTTPYSVPTGMTIRVNYRRSGISNGQPYNSVYPHYIQIPQFANEKFIERAMIKWDNNTTPVFEYEDDFEVLPPIQGYHLYQPVN